MMIRTIATLALMGAMSTVASAQAPASPVAAVAAPVTGALAVEAEVRAKPMLERPNRLGHFYGNTVRRRHYGTLNVNAKHSERPLARYFYIP
jgi:hypothetical protein